MMRRVLRSRGARKFRRNRMAMAAMAVIALYALLALWIAAMQGLDTIGQRTGAFTLRGHPVFGALLATATLEQIGPRTVAGFGMQQDAQRRADHVAQALEMVSQAVSRAERDPTYDVGAVGWAERTIADLSLADLKDMLGAAEDRLNQRDRLRMQYDRLSSLRLAIGRLGPLAERLERVQGEQDAEGRVLAAAREDLSLAIEDAVFAAQDYLGLAGEQDPMGDVDLIGLEDAAVEVGEGERTSGPFYDESIVAELSALAGPAVKRVENELAAVIDDLEPLVEELLPPPTGLKGLLYRFRLSLGTDRQGRSIAIRAVYSAKIALQVGFVTALICVSVGTILGAAAAFFGGWVNNAVIWLYSTLSSVPDLVLLVLLAFMFTGTAVEGTLVPLYAAFGLTYWIGPCRVIRGETMKIKELEYVQAATAIGFGRFYILLKHVIPNTAHLMFINFSLLFIAAIKGEVILTFLGLGLKEGASWGIMISQSQQEVVNGFFWQIGVATFFMFVLVLAFNIVSDALQDAFDPRHVG